MIVVNSGVAGQKRCNWVATSAPTVTDDVDNGYAEGSWMYVTNGDKKEMYTCIDASSGAAVWRRADSGIPGENATMTSLTNTIANGDTTYYDYLTYTTTSKLYSHYDTLNH